VRSSRRLISPALAESGSLEDLMILGSSSGTDTGLGLLHIALGEGCILVRLAILTWAPVVG